MKIGKWKLDFLAKISWLLSLSFFTFFYLAVGEREVLLKTSTLAPRDARLASKLIAKARATPNLADRIKIISAHLMGYPYILHPLTGSQTHPEVFVTRMDGFDCVTYVETVLALAESNNIDDFPERLREIRYEQGVVEWEKRLHYTTEWSEYHIRRGILNDLTLGEGTIERIKRLDYLPGLAPKIGHFRYFPTRMLPQVSRRFMDGDLIYFVSTRKGLDVFHVGLLIKNGNHFHLRHAAHSRKAVVEQELFDFVKANRMSGFIVNRPSQ
jgi:Protein of unknown function (DUF1460)